MNIKSRNNDILMCEESLTAVRHLVESSPSAARALFLLIRQMDRTGLAWALPRHIAKEVGLTEQSTYKAIKCLRDKKFIRSGAEVFKCVFVNSAIAWKGKLKEIESAPFHDPSVLSLNPPTPDPDQ